MSSTSPAERQVMRYAADLARLYSQATEDRRRLASLEATLLRTSEAALHLARSLSLEDAAERLAQAGVDALGLQRAAVYLQRRDRFQLLAQHPADQGFPAFAAARPADLEALGDQSDEFSGPPWADLAGPGGGPVAVLPLLGRGRAVGFIAGQGHLPPFAAALTMLCGHAGVVLENLLLESRRDDEPTGPRRGPEGEGGFHGMLGRSAAVREVFALVERLGRVDSAVLITGETGTGKSLVARALHEAGPRARGPFVQVNCGAIPDGLVESELFGHEPGSFTGAIKLHRGRVEQAQGGTLFLDEVGELPLPVQAKLLTFLEDRRFTRVGGERTLTADLRIVSATNCDLEAAVAERRFRQDLFYRLNVFTVHLPPLRDRGGDVLHLARALAAEIATRYGLPAPGFDAAGEARLLAYPWIGNVRELRNVVEKAVILSGGGPIAPDLLPAAPRSARPARAEAQPAPATPAPASSPAADDGDEPADEPASVEEGLSFADAKNRMVERWEVSYLQALLRTTSGNIARAARLAQLDKKHLQRKIKQYGIDVGAIRGGG